MMEEKNIIAIEIGSSKIKGALGSYAPTGTLTVKAVEEEPLLDWVRYGAVSNVEETSRLVNRIIRKIENRVAPSKVTTVYVALGGRSCCSMRRDVERNLPEEREITEQILSELRSEAASAPLPDRDLLAVVPRQYVIDKTEVSRPKGTVGHNIRFSANLITCRLPTKRNIDILFNDKLQLEIGGYEVRQLALGDLVLTSEEKKLGCMLVDFGAETTTVSIYKKGRLQYLNTLPMGSRNITRDITSLNYLEEKAEELKRKQGNASSNVAAVAHANGIDYTTLNNLVSHRAGEIIANINKQIEYAGYTASQLSGGIVIVGRGSRLAGFNERLQTKTTMKIRSGSISQPEVRIADSRISASDAADVISVLYKAAIHGARECLKMDVVNLEEEPEEDTASLTEETIEPIVENPVPEPARKKKGFMATLRSIKDNLGSALLPIEEPEEDEDEKVLQDDPD